MISKYDRIGVSLVPAFDSSDIGGSTPSQAGMPEPSGLLRTAIGGLDSSSNARRRIAALIVVLSFICLLTSNSATAAAPGCPGDYNGDGICTDAADYVVWRKSPGQFGGSTGYDLWRENFGETSPGSGGGDFNGAAVTPEPSGLLLAMLGGWISVPFLSRRRGTRLRLRLVAH